MPGVTNPTIQGYYEEGLAGGAFGGKLLGAGGSGVSAVVVPCPLNGAMRCAAVSPTWRRSPWRSVRRAATSCTHETDSRSVNRGK